MVNLVRWKVAAGGLTTVLSTEMNALANNTLTALGPVFDGRTLLDQYVDFVLDLPSLTPAAGGYVALYAAYAIDGTNYSDAKREYAPLGIFSLEATASAKRVPLVGKFLPPELMKFYVDNQTGVALAATLNTLKLVAYSPEIQ